MIVEIVLFVDGFDGWQVLESEEKTVKGEKRLYIKSIVHAGAPENFVYYYTQTNDAYRAEYILSNGKTKNSSLTSNIPTKTRNWGKYKDQSKLNLIYSVRCMTYDDALNNGSKVGTVSSWLASARSDQYLWMGFSGIDNGYSTNTSKGVRPVVSLMSGVYAVSGTGTGDDPYILGKD